MNRKPVESSNIKSIGHDGKSTLEVEFHRGGVFQYQPVSHNGYLQMQQAKSIGKWFNENIKDNDSVNYKKMEDEDV